MIPSARMEACEKAPPAKVSIKPSIPFLEALMLPNLVGSIPGSTMCVPIRYMKTRSNVKRIFARSSSMLQIFLRVLIKFFTQEVYGPKHEETQLHCASKFNENYFTISTDP